MEKGLPELLPDAAGTIFPRSSELFCITKSSDCEFKSR
jgi:hypothetical protein